MRPLLASAATILLGMSLAVPALAEHSSVQVSASAGVATSADLACMSAAVDTRESAVITARTNFNAKIMAALEARRAALKTAYTIANNADRRVAIDAAITAYAKAAAEARAKFKADVKAAWNVFALSKANCHIDQNASAGVSVRVHDDDDKENRGLHLGWLKGKMHSKAWINGHVKLDLND